MSDLRKIKRKLINDNKIEQLLENIGCEYVHSEQGGRLITSQLPERFGSTNKRACQVRVNESLTCYIRNRGDFRGDIFSLVSYLHFDKRNEDIQKNLYRSKEFICNLFGWNQFLRKTGNIVVKDYTASLKEIIGRRKKRNEIEPNIVIPEEVMNQFYFYEKPLPNEGWIEEGLSYKAQITYGVGFCLESKRIVFPIRNRFGQLVGVKGRILKDEDDLEKKYLYLYRCNNRYEWFNFYLAHPHILSKKRVYIFEAEKSCMMAYSNGIYNTLAIGSSDISEEQANMVEQLGLDIEIVLCYDKDKTAEEIREQAEIFKGRKVYGMFDVDDLLEDKDSPTDKGFSIWNTLVNNNIYEIA